MGGAVFVDLELGVWRDVFTAAALIIVLSVSKDSRRESGRRQRAKSGVHSATSSRSKSTTAARCPIRSDPPAVLRSASQFPAAPMEKMIADRSSPCARSTHRGVADRRARRSHLLTQTSRNAASRESPSRLRCSSEKRRRVPTNGSAIVSPATRAVCSLAKRRHARRRRTSRLRPQDLDAAAAKLFDDLAENKRVWPAFWHAALSRSIRGWTAERWPLIFTTIFT